MKKTEEKVEKKEFNLDEAFVLWKNTSKNNNTYLTGMTGEKFTPNGKLVAFYNTNKKNAKEPDIKVYLKGEKDEENKEVAVLWDNISESKKQYLTGYDCDKTKLVGFYSKEVINGRPDIRVYFQED